MIYKNIQRNKGYTLLFAVLVSALLLAIGISILNISKKEFLLASSARESTTAFYVADSAIECAAYFDNQGIFDPPTHQVAQGGQNLACGGNNFTVPAPDTVNGNTVYKFELHFSGSACAVVSVTKGLNPDGSDLRSIEARGYNLGWLSGSGCTQASPRRVERALYYSY